MATRFSGVLIVNRRAILARQWSEPLEESVLRVRVVPDSRQHVEGNRLDHVEMNVVVGGGVHAGSVADLAGQFRQ
jgi:hypothetical protein